MARHNIHLGLSQAQAEYLAGAIDADLATDELTPGGRERAQVVLAKVQRALDKVQCAPDCKCRKTPSGQRADARYRASLTAALTESEGE